MSSHTVQRQEGRDAVTDSPKAVIEEIEDDLEDAMAKLNNAQITIEVCQNRLSILRERDEMPGINNE